MSNIPSGIEPSGIDPAISHALPLQPTRRTLMQFIVDRNPFYLFSAVCMFAGCRMIIGALDVAAGDTRKLLLLIGTLNLYEFLLIGLALFLIVRRGLHRDGWILLSIEALFLVDLTFLNGEVFTANLKLGAIVNLICFALALAKVALVIRTLRLRVPWPALGLIALQLAALFGMPGLFKAIAHNGSLSAMQLYAAWWAVGLLPVAAALLARRTPGDSAMRALPGRLYMLLPFIALLAHLAGENRVYWIHFHVANIAPVLLGFAVALGRFAPRKRLPIARLQVALIAIAVVISLPFPAELLLAPAAAHGMWLSPLRLILLGSSATLLYCYALHRRLVFWELAAACFAAAAMGASVEQMLHRSLATARWALRTGERMVPTTPMQWGIAAVAASFVLLAIGAVMSLRKGGGSYFDPVPSRDARGSSGLEP